MTYHFCCLQEIFLSIWLYLSIPVSMVFSKLKDATKQALSLTYHRQWSHGGSRGTCPHTPRGMRALPPFFCTSLSYNFHTADLRHSYMTNCSGCGYELKNELAGSHCKGNWCQTKSMPFLVYTCPHLFLVNICACLLESHFYSMWHGWCRYLKYLCVLFVNEAKL